MSRFLNLAFLALLCGLILGLPHLSAAQASEMVGYSSPSGAFSIMVPEGHKTKTYAMRITSGTVLASEVTKSVIAPLSSDQSERTYIIQLEQTIGPALETDDQNRLIDLELDKYVAHYKSNNATLRSREKKFYDRNPGGEIYMTYESQEHGTQALRARVSYSDRSKILQITTSPDASAFSMKSQEFFDSIQVKNGVPKKNGNVIDDWQEYRSPMNMFSVLMPPVAPPYVTQTPEITGNEKLETISQTIHDPVRNENIQYKITGYRTGRELSPESAQHLILKRHVSRYLNTPHALQFTLSKDMNDLTVLRATFSVRDKKALDGIKVVELRGSFDGEYMMVQELTASKALMQSRFVSHLLGHTLFHPEMIGQAVDTGEDKTDAKEQKPSEVSDTPTKEGALTSQAN